MTEERNRLLLVCAEEHVNRPEEGEKPVTNILMQKLTYVHGKGKFSMLVYPHHAGEVYMVLDNCRMV